jgi:hypothetical protein
MKQYLYWYEQREPYVSHETMIERMVGSTSSASKLHRVIDDNSNPNRNMVMDAMRMNQGCVDQCPIEDKELNANAARFFFIF